MTSNGQQEPAPNPAPDIDKFVDDMLGDAIELRAVLREQGNANDIKERVTCLKYLEEIVKTYFIIKKAATHDPDAAGSTVRKYATAFAKGPGSVGTTRKRGRPATRFPPAADLESDDLGGDDEGAAA